VPEAPVAQQPLPWALPPPPCRCIQAGKRRPRRIRAHDPQVQVHEAGTQRQHRLRAGQQRPPTPARCRPTRRPGSRRGRCAGPRRCAPPAAPRPARSAAEAARRRPARPACGAPGPARHHTAAPRRRRGHPVARQPGVAGAQCGMPGEWELGGSTKVVSDRFIQWAKRCICSPARPSPSSTTATGLPR
jgi:hypothetical protein